MDTSRDTVALTYDELANRLGIDVQSARRRAQRGRWLRTKGNDGRTRVHVPVTVVATVTGTDTTLAEHGPATNATSPGLVAELRRRAEAAEARAEALTIQVAELAQAGGRWEGEAGTERAARQRAEAERDAARAARDAAEAEAAGWMAGGPFRRAFRAFAWRRG